MQIKNILFILGLLACCLAMLILVPGLVSWLYGEYEVLKGFLLCFAGTLLGGIFLSYAAKPPKGEKIQLTPREGVAIVGLCWILATFICAMPYIYITDVSFSKGIFESASGLSTTGGSIFANLEILPKGILFWRSFTQWFGGLGIIVFSLALLPFIGAGGMQLYKAEASGVSKDKVAPKMIDTARSLWGIYTVLTLTLVVILYLQGLNFFEAATHAMSTLATGGFSTRNASIAAFSPLTQWTIILFMYLGSVNFSLHFLFLHGGFKKYFENEEFVYYTIFLLIGIFFIAATLYVEETPSQHLLTAGSTPYTIEQALRDSAFQLISLTTSTGFATADYLQWPVFTQIILLLYMITGGCAGSTAGGLKFMRALIILKLIRNELNRLSHPRAVERIKINKTPIDDSVLKGVLIFFAIYIISILLGTLTLSTQEINLETSFSAIISCISNVGPAFGGLGPTGNFSILNDFDLFLLSFFMLYGRLEIFTILLLFMPKFWRN